MTETGDRPSPPRTPSKSAAAFRTISEVATELDLPQHVLRFWETKFNATKPMKRGGGRRYYRPDDIALLKSIRDLLYDDGYTIKGVQKLLREIGSKSIMESGRSSSGSGALGAAGVAAARTRRQSGVAAAPTAAGTLEPPLSETGPVEAMAAAGEGGGGLSAAHRRKLLHLAAELGELRDILRPPETKN